MKKMALIFLIGMACSCNHAGSESKDVVKDSATATSTSNEAIHYPYAVDHPDNWEIGSSANTLIALNSLKAWELGKMDESLKYFGDTIWVQFDGLDTKLPNDSLKAMFTVAWNDYKTVHENMKNWESVISKDKSEEWVTIWYIQSWETKKGIKDSAAVINDMQIRNGKIIRLNEYARKFH
jgi:hypothetical protein